MRISRKDAGVQVTLKINGTFVGENALFLIRNAIFLVKNEPFLM
jgi:hypothetical protein